MTKRWHSAKDYCADPAGYEAHRRMGKRRESKMDVIKVSVEYIDELQASVAALRAEVKALRGVLALVTDDERKFVTAYRVAADDSIAICNFCKESHQDEYQIEHKPKCPIAQARAALAQEVEE
jgi:hypothetical protein